ncbi:MAG: thioredoxin family protein [Candidatus Freyarchaeota archaeon]|nr:thioredoxin family protein [Candidatus Jordarchaeia archaeon]MBS7267592.1 thioredoxin family protein [Candidatus Jordarchaeia archaeon]MBS7278799.1 thioredoxin family protein [Candidatus Jordarchaeia archaeon]
MDFLRGSLAMRLNWFFQLGERVPRLHGSQGTLNEVAGLSAKIKVEVYDFLKDEDKVKGYRIARVPAIAVVGGRDYGIRIYGLPYGYEFRSFTELLMDASRGTTGLSAENRKKLATMNKETLIQIFVLLKCPYCPLVTRLAFKFSIGNLLIRVDMIDIQIFPNLAQKYHVEGTPKAIINGKTDFSGAIAEELFVQ